MAARSSPLFAPADRRCRRRSGCAESAARAARRAALKTYRKSAQTRCAASQPVSTALHCRIEPDLDQGGAGSRRCTASPATGLVTWDHDDVGPEGAAEGGITRPSGPTVGRLIPNGGVPSQSNFGGCDQSAAALKSTALPENSAPEKLTVPPVNLAPVKPMMPPENSALENRTPPPENTASLKPTVPPVNLAPVKPTLPPENSALENRTPPPENLASEKPTSLPENSAPLKLTVPPENLASLKPTRPLENLASSKLTVPLEITARWKLTVPPENLASEKLPPSKTTPAKSKFRPCQDNAASPVRCAAMTRMTEWRTSRLARNASRSAAEAPSPG